jgi:hypothetical protein
MNMKLQIYSNNENNDLKYTASHQQILGISAALVERGGHGLV